MPMKDPRQPRNEIIRTPDAETPRHGEIPTAMANLRGVLVAAETGTSGRDQHQVRLRGRGCPVHTLMGPQVRDLSRLLASRYLVKFDPGEMRHACTRLFVQPGTAVVRRHRRHGVGPFRDAVRDLPFQVCMQIYQLDFKWLPRNGDNVQ